MPQFGHVSLILAPDRSKLSKRHGATSVGQVWLPVLLSSSSLEKWREKFSSLFGIPFWNFGSFRFVIVCGLGLVTSVDEQCIFSI